MRILNHILICLMLFLGSVGFTAGLDAATRAHVEIPDGSPPIQKQKITVSPFFHLHSNGPKAWVERILVTFMVTEPKTCPPDDLDNPTLRKMIYELLQSGQPSTTIQTQVSAYVQRQMGMKVRPSVQISRSVLIVR